MLKKNNYWFWKLFCGSFFILFFVHFLNGTGMSGLQNGSDFLFLSDFLFNSVDEILMGRATLINSYLAAYLLEFYLLVCGVYYLLFIIYLLQKGFSEFLINSIFLNSLKKNYLILGYFFFNPQLYKISGTFCNK